MSSILDTEYTSPDYTSPDYTSPDYTSPGFLHPTHPAHSRLREQAAGLSERVRHLALVPPVETHQPELKLTRRGRLAMFISTVLMLIVLAIVLGSTTVATDAPGSPVPATMVTVEPGQTLWDLAADANPHGNGQATVADIMRLNSIESAGDLQAGDTIAVPLYQ